MLTGAALATINRLPVLLLPADTFATRVSAPVLQELELPSSGDVTVNGRNRCSPNAPGMSPARCPSGPSSRVPPR
jgi:TPP-dependent trihydroxycyclohexane-1,2-dione (THcHDO) dehydratase